MHTVNPFELFAMKQNNRNGQPYQCVCNIWHTVRSDELFAIRESNRNGQLDQGVCDIYNIQFTRMNCFQLGKRTKMVHPSERMPYITHTLIWLTVSVAFPNST